MERLFYCLFVCLCLYVVCAKRVYNGNLLLAPLGLRYFRSFLFAFPRCVIQYKAQSITLLRCIQNNSLSAHLTLDLTVYSTEAGLLDKIQTKVLSSRRALKIMPINLNVILLP